MSEEEAMQKAKAVWLDLCNQHHSRTQEEQIIAAALMEASRAGAESERERCASIAQSRFTLDSVTKTAKGEPYITGKAAIYAADRIAAAIRTN